MEEGGGQGGGECSLCAWVINVGGEGFTRSGREELGREGRKGEAGRGRKHLI